MPYSPELINEGEEVVLDLHPHWWFFIEPLAALVVALVLGVVAAVAFPDTAAIAAVAAVVVIACLLWFGARYARWVTTHFVVTTDRLIYRHGVVAKHGVEIPLERVNTVLFSQSLWERVLGSGDLVIESAGELGRQDFSNVRRPSDVQNEIHKQMENNENRKFDRIGRGPVMAPTPGDAIASQIRQLEELRREGLLSEDEFARKKQQLLDRM